MKADALGRKFNTLRLSLTNVCNLACLYCVHESDASSQAFLPTAKEDVSNGEKTLNVDEFIKVIKSILRHTSLETVRLTGGEPTLFKDLVPLVKALKDLGIPRVVLTTNGFLLKRKAKALSEAGLDGINFSLDAIDKETFFKMSRRDKLGATLEGIDAALENGIKVKINSVVMKGVNDSEIIPLLDYAISKGVTIRFLELMKMGHLYQGHNEFFFSEEDILWTIAKKYDFQKKRRTNSSTANYWETTDGFKFGIIANESSPFCFDCNRLRLDSFGNIYGCLSDNNGISILDCLDDDIVLEQRLQKALKQKQTVKFTGSDLSMKAIGG
jgi:cyclic pyranopterin phosphate synthase